MIILVSLNPPERMRGIVFTPQSTDVFKRNICCCTNEITVSLARGHVGYEWHCY